MHHYGKYVVIKWQSNLIAVHIIPCKYMIIIVIIIILLLLMFVLCSHVISFQVVKYYYCTSDMVSHQEHITVTAVQTSNNITFPCYRYYYDYYYCSTTIFFHHHHHCPQKPSIQNSEALCFSSVFLPLLHYIIYSWISIVVGSWERKDLL